MRTFALFCVTLLAAASSTNAQNVASKITAPNGVVVDVNEDAFAGRAEYTTDVKFDVPGGGSGEIIIGKTRKSGQVGPLDISGFVVYSGEWQYFNSAVFKGGDRVSFKRTGGQVGDCHGGCTLTELFEISMTPAEIAKHTESGSIAIQIRPTQTTNSIIVSIPVAYIDAVRAVGR